MKVNILKIALLIFSTVAIFGLSGCGSEGISSQDTLVGEDNTPPVITLNGSNPMYLKIGEKFVDPGATAQDKEDGDITVRIQTNGTVDTTKEGVYHITYTVSDSFGMQDMKIRNVIVHAAPVPPANTPPVITLKGANPMKLKVGDKFVDPGATAQDKEDGDLTSKIQTSGTVDTSKPGTYNITYTVTDSGGLSDSKIRSVVVSNTPPPANTPPVITLNGANPMKLKVGDKFVDPGATAQDKEDGDLTSKIQTSGMVDTSKPGTYTITYTVTDSGGLTDSKDRKVIVEAIVVKEVVKKTGQTVSYDENGNPVANCAIKDDGCYQAGAAPRYTRSNDMVTDHVTGLVWEDTPHTGGTTNANLLMIWSGTATPGTSMQGPAQDYCNNLTLGGRQWRLPEIWELLTIADKSQYNPGMDPIFQNVVAGPYAAERNYWTNTPKPGTNLGTTTQYNYTVKFVDGRDEAGLTGAVGNRLSVRCVSGTASGTGLDPANRQFSRDNATGIVTDAITKLQWTDDAASAGQNGTWKEAIAYCEQLTLGGFSDWRLPNLNEYYTIANNKGAKDHTWPSVFQNIVASHHTYQYWTSTSVTHYKQASWLFEFYVGTDTWSAKDPSLNNEPPAPRPGPHRVMCVRNQ